LWSCNRSSEVQGVFSHQTALAIHGLSDVMPANYHFTVPKGFRKRQIPNNIVLHFEELRMEEVREFEGYKVTSPERTIYDVILDKGISDELVFQAVTDALESGLISYSQLTRLGEEIDSDRMHQILQEVRRK